MTLIVKICGITQPEQGQAIAAAGATMLGFICVPASPRYVTPAQIAQIVDALPIDSRTGHATCDRVGVFVNASSDTIQTTVEIAHLNGVQLHGNESPEFCQQLRQQLPSIKLIKALRVRSADALQQASVYQDWVDLLLLDAYHPTLAGGTGKTLDWQSLRSFQPSIPWLLAGGLTPDNVSQALNVIHPTGIDLSSGVEQSPGVKDLTKVAQLFTTLKDALSG
ncbi:MAG: phosphoribosylanthranilate isomerase [Leptolyngbyaceae cyanobacterium bins.302]|nr:phosphoribosylanthranilate isomerase [Leptolyngbyaceae cyanobacterium bins.302]